MNKVFTTTALFAMVALATVSYADHCHKAEDVSKMDIVVMADHTQSFKTLIAALEAADLLETLKGAGPFTVFAPTDEAFDKLPDGTVESLLRPENKEKLQSILTYHVVPGRVYSKDVHGLNSAKTVNGQSLTIKSTGGAVFVDDAQVVMPDIGCSNGVIHIIDKVVLPG